MWEFIAVESIAPNCKLIRVSAVKNWFWKQLESQSQLLLKKRKSYPFLVCFVVNKHFLHNIVLQNKLEILDNS